MPNQPQVGARFARHLLLLLLLGAAIRAVAILATQDAYVPYSDSVRFLWMARGHLGATFVQAPEFHHPLFPWLLAAALRLFGDSLLVARMASALPHLLLLVPLALWTRGVFGERVALWTAALGAVLPGMISACLEVFDVNLAALFLAGMLWTRLVRRTLLRGMAGGLLTGLGYLTRPEFPVFGLGLAAAALVTPLLPGAERRRQVAIEWAGLLLGMLLIAGPYVVDLRIRHGTWMVSPKSAAVLHGMHATAAASTGETLSRVSRLSWNNLKAYLKVFLPMAIPPLLWIALLLGLIVAGRAEGEGRREWEVALIAGSFALTIPVTLVPNYRYLVVVFPLLLPWVGRGLHWAWQGALVRRALVAVAALVSVGLQARALVASTGSFGMEWAQELRVAGMWIRDHSPQDARIGVGRSTAVFYAERGMAAIPEEDLDRATDLAGLQSAFAREGARYLILSERYPPDEPALAKLCHTLKCPVFEKDRGTRRGVAIYDLAPEPGAEQK